MKFTEKDRLKNCIICNSPLSKEKITMKTWTCSTDCKTQLIKENYENKKIFGSQNELDTPITKEYHVKQLVKTIINADNECVLL